MASTLTDDHQTRWGALKTSCTLGEEPKPVTSVLGVGFWPWIFFKLLT